MLLMQNPLHLICRDPNRDTDGNSRRCSCSQCAGTGHTFLAKEISGGEERHRSFLSPFGNNSEFGSTALEVKHGVGGTSLREKDLLRLHTAYASSDPGDCEKFFDVKTFVHCSIRAVASPRVRSTYREKPHNCSAQVRQIDPTRGACPFMGLSIASFLNSQKTEHNSSVKPIPEAIVHAMKHKDG